MFNKDIPWATLLTAVLVAIAAIVGGAVVIWGPDGALSFQQYLDALKTFAVAVGLLGVGRGVKAGLENHAAMSGPMATDEELLRDMPEPDGDGADATARSAPARSSHV